MQKVRVEDAVGQILIHDIARIVIGEVKDTPFRRGHKITEEDKQILGSVRPKFVASMVNNFEFKGFDLSVFLYASVGGLLRNNIEFMEKPGRGNTVKVDYWTSTNPTNAFPRPSVDVEKLDYISTLGYDKADFLRIRNITLGYTLPEALAKHNPAYLFKDVADMRRILLGQE